MSDYEVVWPRDKYHSLIPARATANRYVTAYMGGHEVNPLSIRTPRREKKKRGVKRTEYGLTAAQICRIGGLHRARGGPVLIAKVMRLKEDVVKKVLKQMKAAA